MPMRTCVLAAGLLAVGLVVAGCAFPDDLSQGVYVVVYPSTTLVADGVLAEGETESLAAKAFRQVSNIRDSGKVDDQEITNVDFFWTSGDEAFATVRGGSGGSAEVTGVDPGFVTITARAASFQGADAGSIGLRVAGLYAVDSVRPPTVRYGERVTLFGVRMHLTLGAVLGGEDLIPAPFTFQGSLDGLGRVELWVPPRATSDRLAFIGPGVFGVSDSVSVIEEDLFEPDSARPARIDINGPGGPPTIGGSPTLFFNPALFYEPVEFGQSDVDWFRFVRADTTQAVTLILNSTVLNDTAFSYLSDTLAFDSVSGGYFVVPGSWILSPGFYVCNNRFFFPAEERPVSTIIALRNLPDTAMQLLSFYARDGRYELGAIAGYQTVDRRIGPDRFEENDLWCRFADRNFANPALQITISPTISFEDSTLTIDNPHDIDWYKFRVTVSDTVTVQLRPRPLAAGVDPSNVDLYVMRASDFSFVGSDVTAGSFAKVKAFLAAGDYYVGVVDRIGVPTRYSMCIKKSIECSPPGAAPPRAAGAAASRGATAPAYDPTVPPPGWGTSGPRMLPSPRR